MSPLTCDICRRVLSTDRHSPSFNCGGTCRTCMAVVGEDPDCMRALSADPGPFQWMPGRRITTRQSLQALAVVLAVCLAASTATQAVIWLAHAMGFGQ